MAGTAPVVQQLIRNAFMIISMRTALVCLAITSAVGVAAPATAARYVATDTNFSSVFASAQAGDTIVLNGRFGATLLADRSFATRLNIDARDAQFTGALTIRNMRGVAITGGSFGGGGAWQDSDTIKVQASNGIRFIQPQLTADGSGRARGLTFRDSSNIAVSNGSFSGFRLAIGINGVRNGNLTNNRITAATSDGINIVNSHFVTARGNVCSDNLPSPGAHPDCIQLWSLAGFPVQSDIKLIGNTALGYTQGFTSFDPDRGGGLRISMIGNRVDTSQPQGIACYGCVDSVITDNVLTTLPGARFRTYLRVIGGSNNIVERNSIGPLPAPVAASAFSARALASVPEPGIWAQCLLGFGLLGSVLRRRRSAFELQPQELRHVFQHRGAAAKRL
jgi:hypothetical protein